jgi:choline dehydrogenase
MQYLTHPDDWSVLRAALRTSIAVAECMREGVYDLKGCNVPDSADDTVLDAFIKANADTMYHYSSTCRMASMDDKNPGVVDDELRVHGIPNLRIADASVFPVSPATHPQALVYAVAEKCADMIMKNF